jgi:beta-glucanase (GH16 family)
VSPRARAIALAFVCVLAAPATAGATARSYSWPLRDAEVRAGAPDRVAGTGRSLCVQAAGHRAYLSFRVRVPRGRVVTRATLRLRTLVAAGPYTVVLRAAPRRRWSERTLTWRNAAPPGAPVAAAGGFPRGANIYFDATRLVSASGVVDMALTTRSRSCLRFGSREAARARRPRLIVETEKRRATPAGPWNLVFDDEFDGNALDRSKWSVGNFTGQGNFYTPTNVLLRNGILRLRASAANHSAMVHTHGHLDFTYGRVEVSMRAPRGQGLWPSVWMRPSDLVWPYPEIDLVEMWLTDDPSDLYDERTAWLNYHWYDAAGIHHSAHTHHRPGPDFSEGFHQFAVEWEPGAIRFYIDGVQVKDQSGGSVARVPLFLVLSLQVGHYAEGGIHASGEPSSNTHFPAYEDVDYVRVYRR